MLLPIILLSLVVIVAVLMIVAACRPAGFRIVRSATIAAPPAEVFPHANDLQRFQAWSPWAKLDPAMRITFEGPAAGVGATSAWEGNNKVGAGRMTVTESRPPDLVRWRLEFLRPFKATNAAELTFQADGPRTSVSWSMTGRNNFVFRIFCLFMDMDKLVGRDFEKGLAQLKALVERK